MHDQMKVDLKKHFETGMEERNKVTGYLSTTMYIYVCVTRNSNQTQIDKSNLGDLKVK